MVSLRGQSNVYLQLSNKCSSYYHPSKTSYERQLKMWNLRKNQKHEDLKFIKSRLEASQQEGKEIEVYVGGRRLERLKRADRCFIPELEKYKRKFPYFPHILLAGRLIPLKLQGLKLQTT